MISANLYTLLRNAYFLLPLDTHVCIKIKSTPLEYNLTHTSGRNMYFVTVLESPWDVNARGLGFAKALDVHQSIEPNPFSTRKYNFRNGQKTVSLLPELGGP